MKNLFMILLLLVISFTLAKKTHSFLETSEEAEEEFSPSEENLDNELLEETSDEDSSFRACGWTKMCGSCRPTYHCWGAH